MLWEQMIILVNRALSVAHTHTDTNTDTYTDTDTHTQTHTHTHEQFPYREAVEHDAPHQQQRRQRRLLDGQLMVK